MSDYSELKKLAEAATPGPWAYYGSYVCPARTEDGTTYVELWRSIADCHQPENTKFIAAANPAAVLALIAEVEALRKDAEQWKTVQSAIDQLQSDERNGSIWTVSARLLISVAHKLNSSISTVTEEGVTIGDNEVGDWRVTVERIDTAMTKGDQP